MPNALFFYSGLGYPRPNYRTRKSYLGSNNCDQNPETYWADLFTNILFVGFLSFVVVALTLPSCVPLLVLTGYVALIGYLGYVASNGEQTISLVKGPVETQKHNLSYHDEPSNQENTLVPRQKSHSTCSTSQREKKVSDRGVRGRRLSMGEAGLRKTESNFFHSYDSQRDLESQTESYSCKELSATRGVSFK